MLRTSVALNFYSRLYLNVVDAPFPVHPAGREAVALAELPVPLLGNHSSPAAGVGHAAVVDLDIVVEDALRVRDEGADVDQPDQLVRGVSGEVEQLLRGNVRLVARPRLDRLRGTVVHGLAGDAVLLEK